MSWKALDWSLTVEVSTPIERLILMLLANRADESLSCYPSTKRLVTESCAARSTVFKTLRKLEDDGLILRVAQHHESGARRSNQYLLNLSDVLHERRSPEFALPRSTITTLPVRSSDNDGLPPVRLSARGTDPLNPSKEPSSEPGSASLLDSLPRPWRVSGEDARKLTPAIEAAFAAGWTSQTLLAHLSSRPDGVRHAAAVLARRLSELPPPPRWSKARRAPWCGECEDSLSRTITITQSDGTEAATFCPRCSPQMQNASTEATIDSERR